MDIEIVSSNPSNTVSLNRVTFTVTQIIRFSSGNFYKQTYPCVSYKEALSWAKSLEG